MKQSHDIVSDIAFTPAVKAIQTRKGSRSAYARMEQGHGWNTVITPDLATLISAQTSIFVGTANGAGQPYIQHRGGPPGFLRVRNERTIAFADFRGNRQFITHGNLAENPKAFLFLIDYAHRQRIKIWGNARMVEGDTDLLAEIMPHNYKAKAEQVVLFTVEAWDANCPQHIPQRFGAAEVGQILKQRDDRIAELEAELARVKGAITD